MKRTFSFLTGLIMLSAPATLAQETDDAGFVTLLGIDTIAVESMTIGAYVPFTVGGH